MARGVGVGVGAGVGVAVGEGVGFGVGRGVGAGVRVGEGVGEGVGAWSDAPGIGLDANSLAPALAAGGRLAAPGDVAETVAAALGGWEVVTTGVEDDPRSGRETTAKPMSAAMKSSSIRVVPRSDASRSPVQGDCRRSRPERMG